MSGLRGVVTVSQFAAAAQGGQLLPVLGPSSTAVTASPPSGTRPLAMPPQLGQVLARIVLSDVRERFTTGTTPAGQAWRPLKNARINSRGTDHPLRDTGVLLASLHTTVEPDGVALHTTNPSAGVHNFGGTIRPKRAKHLAIPLTKEAKRAGSPRRLPRPLKVRPVRRGAKTLVMYELVSRGRGKNKTTVPVDHFLLVESVTIPAREFMGLSGKGMGLIDSAIADWASRGWLSGGSLP